MDKWSGKREKALESYMLSVSASMKTGYLCYAYEPWSDTHMEPRTQLYLNFHGILYWQLVGNCAVGSCMLLIINHL